MSAKMMLFKVTFTLDGVGIYIPNIIDGVVKLSEFDFGFENPTKPTISLKENSSLHSVECMKNFKSEVNFILQPSQKVDLKRVSKIFMEALPEIDTFGFQGGRVFNMSVIRPITIETKHRTPSQKMHFNA
jgi:hypothetical protein